MKKTNKLIKAEQEQKPRISEVLVKQLAELNDAEQQRVLGFAQGITYAKLTSKGA